MKVACTFSRAVQRWSHFQFRIPRSNVWSRPVGQATHCKGVTTYHVDFYICVNSFLENDNKESLLINSQCYDDVPTGRVAFLKFSHKETLYYNWGSIVLASYSPFLQSNIYTLVWKLLLKCKLHSFIPLPKHLQWLFKGIHNNVLISEIGKFEAPSQLGPISLSLLPGPPMLQCEETYSSLNSICFFASEHEEILLLPEMSFYSFFPIGSLEVTLNVTSSGKSSLSCPYSIGIYVCSHVVSCNDLVSHSPASSRIWATGEESVCHWPLCLAQISPHIYLLNDMGSGF